MIFLTFQNSWIFFLVNKFESSQHIADLWNSSKSRAMTQLHTSPTSFNLYIDDSWVNYSEITSKSRRKNFQQLFKSKFKSNFNLLNAFLIVRAPFKFYLLFIIFPRGFPQVAARDTLYALFSSLLIKKLFPLTTLNLHKRTSTYYF